MDICLLLKRPLGDPASPVVNAMALELQRRGLKVGWILPHAAFINFRQLTVESDLYVFRTSMPLVLTLGAILHDRGARMINTFPASSFVRDKARVTAALMSAGFPVPQTCIAGDVRMAVEGFGNVPIIIKPPLGSGGKGIEIVRSADDETRVRGGPHFAQIYERINPYDLKVYVLGEQIFVVRKKFPAVTVQERRGAVCACDGEIARIALGVGRLLKLDLFGMDIVETHAGPVIVDVNSSPSFMGVPHAAKRLAAYFVKHWKGSEAPRAQVRRSPQRPTPELTALAHDGR